MRLQGVVVVCTEPQIKRNQRQSQSRRNVGSSRFLQSFGGTRSVVSNSPQRHRVHRARTTRVGPRGSAALRRSQTAATAEADARLCLQIAHQRVYSAPASGSLALCLQRAGCQPRPERLRWLLRGKLPRRMCARTFRGEQSAPRRPRTLWGWPRFADAKRGFCFP